MSTLLLVNRVVIAVFAVASGLYKLVGGTADVELFARVGLSAAAVTVFGAIQATAGVLLFVPRFRVAGAVVLVLCNAFASYGLFAGGVQPFGYVSILFVLMAVIAAL